MSKRQDFLDRCRQELGTKFKHQGRLSGVGLDCAGLIVTCARSSGIFVVDSTTYTRRPDPQILTKAMLETGVIPISFKDAIPGDILLFQYDANPQHLAVLTQKDPDWILHAAMIHGKVVEQPLDISMKNRMNGVFRFKFEDET